jgi:hypothetical protein
MAIFHFDGKGTQLEIKLPAIGTLKRDLPPAREPTDADVSAGLADEYWQRSDKTPDEDPKKIIRWTTTKVLIFQAEKAPDGKSYYGIISSTQIRKATADDLAEIKPLESK